MDKGIRKKKKEWSDEKLDRIIEAELKGRKVKDDYGPSEDYEEDYREYDKKYDPVGKK